ncbi:MAG: RHS repeat protein [Desulfobacterales bacterium]|nr:RHS repeat protein [Desulfobacterales bacterium]
MTRTEKITFIFLGLLLLLPYSLDAGDNTLNFGKLKAPTMRVETVTAAYDSARKMLVLQAALNYDPALLKDSKAFSIQWTTHGDANGFALVAGPDRFQSGLKLGQEGLSVVVKACLVYGKQTGGCRTITLKSEKIQTCIDKEQWQKIPEKEWDDLICTGASNDEYQYVFYKVRSTVNTLTGKYNRSDIDMRVKVPGGTLVIKRKYDNDQWHWDHEKDSLAFEYDKEGALHRIKKGRVLYRRSPDDRLLFTHGTYRIQKNDDGFWWEDKRGNFKAFNTDGRITLFGNRSGVIGRYLYKKKADGHLVGIQDRHRRQVMKLRYLHGHLESIADPRKRRVRYRYLDGRLQSVISPANRKTLYDYHPDGTLATITDPEGHKIAITYDENQRVASVTDEKGQGNRFKFRYDQKRRLYYVRTESTTGRIREVWHTKDGEAREVRLNGKLVKKIEKQGKKLIITGPGGHRTVKEFDRNENLLQVAYPDGSQISHEYHPKFNRKTRSVDENGIITEYAYDKKGRLIKRVEAAGRSEQRTTEYGWDEEGNRILEKRLGDSRTAEAVTKMAYDKFGNMTAITDAEGNTTRFTHDYRGNVITRIDPTGARWMHTYDLSGNRIKTIDPLGQVTEFRYDALGNRIAVTDPAGSRTCFTYDDNRRMTEKLDPLGGITRFEYNADGKVTRQVDPEGKQTRTEYDSAGRLAATIDGASNKITMEYANDSPGDCKSCGTGNSDGPQRIHYPTFTREFVYDLRGRKIAQKDIAEGRELRVSRFRYDAVGNLIEKIDPMGNTTWYAYDGLKRLIKTTDAMGGEIRYVYDQRDNLIALADAMGNTTRFEYDRNNKMVKETRPMGQATVYKYDAVGNLSEKIDPRGVQTVYEYDLASRMVRTAYFPTPEAEQPVKTVTFAYDRLGNMTAYDDDTSSAKYEYDLLNRKTTETVNYGKFALTYRYEYYKNSLKKKYISPDKKAYGYTYDEANRLRSVSIPGQGDMTWGAHNWNQPGQITMPGGTVRTVKYDPLMRIKAILAKTDKNDTILDYRYTYDRADNITHKTTEHGEYKYTYDDLYQLTGAINPKSDDESFVYDKVGNRLEDDKTEGRWEYNGNNELLRSGQSVFKYDAAGNTTEKSTTEKTVRYSYNPENRLIKIDNSADNTVARYYYDPFGRRLYKEVDGQRTYFLYTDEGLSGEYNQKGKAIKSYGYKPGSTWTTDPLFMKIGRQCHYYHNDHIGTPQRLTNKKGNIEWSAIYDAYGKTCILKDSKVSNSLRFPGQHLSTESGLHYNYHRYYDPLTGIYIKADPIGLASKGSTYSYADNNPANKIDPNGLYSEFGFSLPGVSGLPRVFEMEVEKAVRYTPEIVSETLSEVTKCIACTVTCNLSVYLTGKGEAGLRKIAVDKSKKILLAHGAKVLADALAKGNAAYNVYSTYKSIHGHIKCITNCSK